VAGIVWMNQQLLRFELRPGAEDPGPADWGTQAVIPAGHRRGLLATFNGGFKIANSQGGFYLNGITRGSLHAGAASMVFYRSGRMTVGVWDRGVRMSPAVAGVRQNLKPIVQDGRVPATVNSNIETTWGATLGGGYYVWRSGIGVTRDGRIVFVYGPALNVQDLASLLRRAGCVTAMQLDINPDWMSFMYYLPPRHPGDPTPVNLLPDQVQPPDRYYSLANRDFTAVFAR
jgi:Phosphodiester glycosidase